MLDNRKRKKKTKKMKIVGHFLFSLFQSFLTIVFTFIEREYS